MRLQNWIIAGAMGTFAVGCVPAKKVSEITDKYEKCEESRGYLSAENAKLEKANNELTASVDRMTKKMDDLAKDTARLGEQLKNLNYQYEQLQATNKALVEKQDVLVSGSKRENQELLNQLLEVQNDLQAKEDSLKLLAYDLNVQQKELSTLNTSLQEREARVKELEDLLAQKDAAVNALKNQIKNALIGFEDKGISVEQKNGRVYVSMEAKLLFNSGSALVNAEGKTVVTQLASALENQEDLTILVEGHTDSDKLSGTGKYKDNWELSSERAIAVVRIMLKNSEIDPQILTAAGRGEYNPVAENNSPENKAKNRRIEVILTPNLDKLFEILDESAQ